MKTDLVKSWAATRRDFIGQYHFGRIGLLGRWIKILKWTRQIWLYPFG
jgi:hypothetical protein